MRRGQFGNQVVAEQPRARTADVARSCESHLGNGKSPRKKIARFVVSIPNGPQRQAGLLKQFVSIGPVADHAKCSGRRRPDCGRLTRRISDGDPDCKTLPVCFLVLRPIPVTTGPVRLLLIIVASQANLTKFAEIFARRRYFPDSVSGLPPWGQSLVVRLAFDPMLSPGSQHEIRHSPLGIAGSCRVPDCGCHRNRKSRDADSIDAGKIEIDADLETGISPAVSSFVRMRRTCAKRIAVWLHAMWDNDNLYLFARWIDDTRSITRAGLGNQGFAGDCLQVRTICFAGARNCASPEATSQRHDAHHGPGADARQSRRHRYGVRQSSSIRTA